MNLLPGLHEALRLMALNDLDFAPGTIMKRIEQLEGVTSSEEVDAEVRDAAKIVHLKSTLAQRDEQLRVALDEVRQWKESVESVALASQEVENELKAALGELVNDCMASDFNEHWDSFTHAQSLLNERSK